MIARPYQREDAKACDRLTRNQGITTPGLDEIFVVGNRGEPRGMLVYRPGAYVHELECGADSLRRLRADALANYAVAHARAHQLRSAIFLVRAGNLAMMRWAESIGAVKQTEPGDELYLLTPP